MNFGVIELFGEGLTFWILDRLWWSNDLAIWIEEESSYKPFINRHSKSFDFLASGKLTNFSDEDKKFPNKVRWL